MFNLLTGALRANSGEIAFAGRSITRDQQRQIARSGMARTFQHVKLRPRMTLLDNVLLGTYSRTKTGLVAGALRLEPGGGGAAPATRRCGSSNGSASATSRSSSPAICRSAISASSRSPARSPPIRRCSCSTSRRPACAARRSSSSPNCCGRCARTALTILLVEHDMEFVMSLVDRIVVLDFGSKLCEGEPAAIRSDARVQEAYLGGVA